MPTVPLIKLDKMCMHLSENLRYLPKMFTMQSTNSEAVFIVIRHYSLLLLSLVNVYNLKNEKIIIFSA